MPKIIELTFELNINRVSCPGVWLCQDGLVSLTVLALGTSYHTCMLPPIFPLMFKDSFYFRKRFQATCNISNLFCLLKDETIYCELVQWSGSCGGMGECNILAQYLGALNDVLFPPNLCSTDGVDLLMRRSKGFPGILAPKIEISTKVRIDEVYNQPDPLPPRPVRIKPCECRKCETDPARQRQVCHTPMYHRCRHGYRKRARSAHSGSCCSVVQVREPDFLPQSNACGMSKSRMSLSARQYHQYQVYNVSTPKVESAWQAAASHCSSADNSDLEVEMRTSTDKVYESPSKHKLLLESNFIEQELNYEEPLKELRKHDTITKHAAPCTCEICKRYYELFHSETVS